MSLSLSKRSDFIVQSEIRNMSVECDKRGGINLSQGICDTEVSPVVRRAAQAAIDEGVNSYTRYDGVSELREALAQRLRRYNGLEYDPDGEIIVSAGSTGAFYCACLALLNAGDEVILFEPYYGYHAYTLLAAGAVPRFVPMRVNQDKEWVFDERDVTSAINSRTKGLMINTPANPSGKVWSRQEIELVADIARRSDLFVFTDEIYEYLVYDERKHISPATVSDLRERTITMSGLSKTFSVTGWRVGFAACDRRWAKMIGYMNDLVYVCAPAPLQVGVARGLSTLGSSYYEDLRDGYVKKRDLLCTALSDAGLAPFVPAGAYYVLADVSRIPGRTSKERAMNLLESTGVACVPGSAFFHDEAGDKLARFCFAKSEADLQEACRRLRRGSI